MQMIGLRLKPAYCGVLILSLDSPEQELSLISMSE